MSRWRGDVVIPALEREGVPFFNPQREVGVWRMSDKAREEEEKKASDSAPFSWMPKPDNSSSSSLFFFVTIVFGLFFQQVCKTLLFVLKDRSSEYSMLEIAHSVSLK